VDAYIRHRLAIAGGKDAVKFDTDALARIADLSDGLPRRINLLCDRALELGRVAGVTTITAPLISRAAKAIAGVASTVTSTALVTTRASMEALDTAEPASASRRTDEPISDELLKDLDLSTSLDAEQAFDQPLHLIMDTPPARSGVWFWLLVMALAGGGAAGVYFAIRSGWLKL